MFLNQKTMSERFPIPPYQNAIVREAAVDETLVPPNSVELAVNVQFDRIGAMTRRPGVTRLGAQLVAATPILGMGVYRNNAGSTYAVVAKVGTTVKAYSGSSWSNVRTGLTASSKAFFSSLGGYLFMVNGHGNEICATWAGSGSFGTTYATSLPKGDFVENYRSRIWVADNSTDRVYYTDPVDTDDGTISGGTASVLISPQDGEKITGLKRSPRALLVFKQNHIYRVFNPNSQDPDPYITRGTYSQESIIEAKDGIYYHHPTGFYKYVDGQVQEEISRPILDVLQVIPRASYENVAGWADEDHIYWSIGDITLGGISLSNVVCRRTISTQLWTVYSHATEFKSSTLYDNGTTLTQLVGDDDGNVQQYNTGNDDNGSAIFFDVVTHWTYFTENKSFQKTFSKLIAFHENAQGINISYQIDRQDQGNTNNSWKSAGNINKDIFDTLSIDAKNFIRIRFRISGSSVGTPFIFRNFEIQDLISK